MAKKAKQEEIMSLLRKLAMLHKEFTWRELRELFAEASIDVEANRNTIQCGLSAMRASGVIEPTETRGRWKSNVSLTPDGLIAIDWDQAK